MENKTNFYKWGFFSLLLILLSTIATVVIHSQTNEKQEQLMSKVEPRNVGWGRYFREQLDLDHEQHMQFREYRQEFHHQAHAMAADMDKIREKILKELSSNNSNKDKLDKLSDEIGLLHTGLKKLTNAYYLNLKSVCTPEQQVKLYTVFRQLSEGNFTGHGKGRGRNRNTRQQEQTEEKQKDVFEEFEQ